MENPLKTLWQGALNAERAYEYTKRNRNFRYIPEGVGKFNCGGCGRWVAGGGLKDERTGRTFCSTQCAEKGKTLPPVPGYVPLGTPGSENATAAPLAPAAFNLHEHKYAHHFLGKHPNLMQLFLHDDDDPEEAVHNFIECLDKHEKCIMNQSRGDLRILLKLKEDKQRDVDESAKSLAMEE